MYQQTHQDKECSKCGALNNYEYVSLVNTILIRCKACGHEKVQSTLTTNVPPDAKPVVYDAVAFPDKEKF